MEATCSPRRILSYRRTLGFEHQRDRSAAPDQPQWSSQESAGAGGACRSVKVKRRASRLHRSLWDAGAIVVVNDCAADHQQAALAWAWRAWTGSEPLPPLYRIAPTLVTGPRSLFSVRAILQGAARTHRLFCHFHWNELPFRKRPDVRLGRGPHSQPGIRTGSRSGPAW